MKASVGSVNKTPLLACRFKAFSKDKSEGEKIITKLELDPIKAEAAKKRRAYHLHVVEIPYLRLMGFGLLSVVIWLHNRYILGHFSWENVSSFFYVLFGYGIASWTALYLFFDKLSKFNLGVFFLTLDIALWTGAIYYTGGDKSLLLFLLLVRVADQTNTTFRRVMFYCHMSPIAYLIMLLYMDFMEGRAVPWTAEGVKIFMLYVTGIYLSLTAETAERIRNRTKASMQLARDLVLKLEGKTTQLNEAKLKAEEGSRVKSEFIANMSHELRTPLNHIIGFTELIVDSKVGNLNEVQKEYLQDVLRSSKHLLLLINDVLDLSKLEAGKLDLDLAEVNLRALLEESISVIKEKAIKHGLRVEMELQKVPEVIRADERKLKQVMYNLLSNAVKFTHEGGLIRVTGRIIELLRQANEPQIMEGREPSFSGESRKYVELVVSDTGIGLKQEDLERIFDRFEQIESTASRRYQGTGLGLFLAKGFVEMHEGKIWAESEGEGKGSRFRFFIPLG